MLHKKCYGFVTVSLLFYYERSCEDLTIGSKIADPHPASVSLLQYIQDKQEVTLNDRFGVRNRPSYDFSDIQAGMSGMSSKPAIPWHLVYVLVAATPDLHILQSHIDCLPKGYLYSRTKPSRFARLSHRESGVLEER